MRYRLSITAMILLLMVSYNTGKLTEPPALASQSDAQAGCLNMDVTLSPDGQQIAFTATQDDRAMLYIARIDGADLRYLTDGEHPQWSPDGDWIAFDRREKGRYTLHRIRSDGSPEQFLTEGANPQWSPIISMGNRLTWVRLLCLTAVIFGIARHRRVKMVRLSVFLLGGSLLIVGLVLLPLRIQRPHVPWILFASQQDKAGQIQRSRSDGSRVLALAEMEGNSPLYLWTDTGKGIILVDENAILYVNPTTRRTHLLAEMDRTERIFWSPEQDLAVEAQGDIYLLTPHNTLSQLIASGSSGSWSPDGTWLAYARGNDFYLHSERLDKTTSLTDLPGYTRQSVWTPDSQWVLLVQRQRTTLGSRPLGHNRVNVDFITWSEIYRLHPDGAGLQRIIASNPSVCPIESQRAVP